MNARAPLIIATLLALAILASIALNDRGDSSNRDLLGRTAEDPAAPEDPGLAIGDDVSEPASRASRRSATSKDAEGDRPDEEIIDPAAATLIGRVVTMDDEPIADMTVHVISGAWRERGDVPVLPALAFETYPTERRGFSGITDAEGRFEVDIPFESGASGSIVVAGHRFIDRTVLKFGDRGTSLHAGINDFGVVRLGRAGAIFGSVTDGQGTPIRGVRIGTGGTTTTTFNRGAVTRADGSFVVPHAGVGTYKVSAQHDEYLRGFVEDIEVVAGKDVGPVSFVLRESPTFEGRFVDESGQAIEGVKLLSWPTEAGRLARARSDSDGYFVVHLRQKTTHGLGATHPDYASWGDTEGRGSEHEPGTHFGTITLETAERIRFEVIGRSFTETAPEPVTEFGIAILRDAGRDAEESNRREYNNVNPGIETRPEGRIELGAFPGRDAVVVRAKGFIDQRATVRTTPESVANGDPTQTIELERGASFRGRAVKRGEPVADATVEIVELYDNDGAPVEMSKSRKRTDTDADGRFEFSGFTGSYAYRLTIAPQQGAPSTLELEPLKRGEARDLGEIELVEGGSIVGRVLLPADLDPSGIEIYRGDWRRGPECVTNANGEFRFDDVPSGKTQVGQKGKHGILMRGGEIEVAVESGKTTNVVLDVRAWTLVALGLELDLVGTPPPPSLEGLRVYAHAKHPAGQGGALQNRRTGRFEPPGSTFLGVTDDQGVIESDVRTLGEVVAEVWLPHGPRLTQSSPTFRLDDGTPLQQEVRVEYASMSFELPSGASLPENGRMSIVLEDGKGDAVELTHRITEGYFREQIAPWIRRNDRMITVLGLPPGPRRVAVYASEEGAEMVPEDIGGGITRIVPVRSFDLVGTATLVAHQLVNVELQER